MTKQNNTSGFSVIQNGRISWIDELKGFACVCVCAGHCMNLMDSSHFSTTNTILIKTFLLPFFNGALMVSLFAVLSGYLTALGIGKDKPLFKSMLKRYLQLMFPILFTGLVVFSVQHTFWFAGASVRAALGNNDASYLTMLPFASVLHESIIGVLFLGHAKINSAFWMMRSLFVGSLLSIFLCWLVSRKNCEGGEILSLFF